MLSRTLSRLFASLVVIFGAITLIFLILNWLPGDPAVLIAGENATPETVEHVRHQLALDRPLWIQYTSYLSGLLRGDLGQSYITHGPVFDHLIAHVPATAKLAFSAAGVAIVLGVLLGVLSARFQGRWIDQVIQLVTLAIVSVPPFWLGMLGILVFSVQLGWLPVLSNDDSFSASILPVGMLGVWVAVHLSRVLRSGLLEELHEPYITTLWAKGLDAPRIFYVHALRNALIASVTYLSVMLGELLSGAVVLETLFARQGLGRAAVEAIGNKDLPVVQGAILLASVTYVLINLLVDLSYVWIDPRLSTNSANGAR